MASSILTFAIGVICIILGIMNTRGNISSLHSYHTKRVAKENVPAFGKLVGLGTIIIGVGVILFSILSVTEYYTKNEIFVTIGMVIMSIGFVVGIALSFYAMKKYNGGIF